MRAAANKTGGKGTASAGAAGTDKDASATTSTDDAASDAPPAAGNAKAKAALTALENDLADYRT